MKAARPAAEAETETQAPLAEPSVRVSVVITCFNHGHWLGDAITSVLEQTHHPIELIVVDDGSTDDTAEVCKGFPEVRYVHQRNAGLAAARNTGIGRATGRYLCCLDADDLLLPHAIATGVAALTRNPGWGFAYGGYSVITGARELVRTIHADRGEVAYGSLLTTNRVRMHATVLYRQSALEEAGAFDTTLPASEDYDMMLRIARRHPVGSHGVIVAEYRQHDANMSHDAERMLTSSLTVLQAQEGRVRSAEEREELNAGVDSIKRYYGARLIRQALLDLANPARLPSALRRLALARRAAPQAYLAVVTGGPRSLLRTIYRALPGRLGDWARAARDRAGGRPPLGKVNFGDLRRLEPIDADFGFGRGIPVDRHYIEGFLGRHAGDVKGRVLEIGDNTYTLRFGGDRVARSDVLDVRADAPNATFVGDLQDAPALPDDAFDCIVLTQTLHLIFDMGRALETLHRVLRPGGVLLITVPGISQIDRGQWGESWYWSLTAASMRRLLADGWGQVSVETHGNVLSAISFLHGLSVADLAEDELAAKDPAYTLVVTARAVKPMDGTRAPPCP